ncbi:MAG: hypothetical protein FVQ84_09890 [Planctomycetes bacterium]|nr:hypothetical protein [Planctomycetota bacterium]
MKNVFLICSLLALTAGSVSASVTVDFENPPLPLGTILTDYAGLSWGNFQIAATQSPASGSYAAKSIGMPPFSYPADTPYVDFSSVGPVKVEGAHFWYTLWRAGDIISADSPGSVTGYLGTGVVGSQILPMSGTPSFISISFPGAVDRIEFTRPTDWNGRDVNISMDDLTYSVIPTPGALLLSSIGMCLLGWMRRRKIL